VSGAAERRIQVRRVVSAAGDLLVVESGEPVPIGTRVSVDPAQVGIDEPGAEPLRGKVNSIERAAEGFAITLRLHSVTRARRDAIAAAIR
jgi:hypothetical protein